MHYLKQLKKDKKLAEIITAPLPPLTLRKNIPLRLMASIMSQQLSTKVALVIYKRFIGLFDGKEPKPQQVLDVPFEALRGIGLSNAKVNYIHNVARFCIENNMNDKKLVDLSDEQIVEQLITIKGVGRWTVEMLLMFTLAREDVFAADDLIIQQGMIKLYDLNVHDKKLLKAQMLNISAKWEPYRTYACLRIWRSKDAMPPVKKVDEI